jgi:F5/8 type C domain
VKQIGLSIAFVMCSLAGLTGPLSGAAGRTGPVVSAAGTSAPSAVAPTAPIVLDDFEDIEAWSAHPASGVRLDLSSDTGEHGKALRLDFDFQKGGGYAVARRALNLHLPPNYRFTFRIRGDAPDNNLEFKLLAPGMDNVWWLNRRDYHFPRTWQTYVIRKRHISFAWGPAGGGEATDVAALEIAITAGSGGKGTVWLDDLVLEPLPEPGAPLPIRASASSAAHGAAAALAIDDDARSAWSPAPADRSPRWTADLGAERPLGGIVLHWAPGRQATDYDVAISTDAVTWQVVREVRNGDGGDDPILLTDTDARAVRIDVQRSAAGRTPALAGFDVMPLEWGASRNAFFEALAQKAPRGRYPRGYLREQSYWTVVGLDADREESLIDEDGRIEFGKGQCSIEPFLHVSGRLISWADAETEQGLTGEELPLPWTRWKTGDLTLEVSAFTAGVPESAAIIVRYSVMNGGGVPVSGTLDLAIRPFQVNPPSQFLNTTGGTAIVHGIRRAGDEVAIDGVPRLQTLTRADAFGAATFDEGDVTTFLDEGRVPPHAEVDDPFGAASAALAYAFDLPPGASRTFDVRMSLDGASGLERGGVPEPAASVVTAAIGDWRARIAGATIGLPDSAVAQTLNAQVGWILVNRDGASIQPGSRSYERSWIRDGSLTSTALLRLGHAEVVREFIDWFAPYQYDDGKVPCCVDQRGSDPVPEHDSSGEFIYLIAEYLRHTGDRALAERMWPRVDSAVAYLDSLRQTRRTDAYRAPDQIQFFGLLPPSISHEGYSAKPMHSYWDDFFALKGFADAASLAGELGRPGDAARIGRIHDEFQRELIASIRASMKAHDIDYIPGAADLGDFDATSTTIALSPAGALGVLPRAAVERTFERYWSFFVERRDGVKPWDAMTPYEVRTIGAFVRLGWRDRANQLLAWFMTLRRPPGWKHWAEVVDHDPRHARFIGDMPHTWVGSDFVRSVLDMLAYERESDRSIVIGAGVPWAWVAEGDGVVVRDLSTEYGPLSFTMKASGDALELRIEGDGPVPPGGFVLDPPAHAAFRSARVNGRRAPLGRDGSLVVRKRGVTVRFEP